LSETSSFLPAPASTPPLFSPMPPPESARHPLLMPSKPSNPASPFIRAPFFLSPPFSSRSSPSFWPNRRLRHPASWLCNLPFSFFKTFFFHRLFCGLMVRPCGRIFPIFEPFLPLFLLLSLVSPPVVTLTFSLNRFFFPLRDGFWFLLMYDETLRYVAAH